MIEVLPKEGEDYTTEMSAAELLAVVRSGKVNAPVGTKTFFCVMVGADNKLEAAGVIAPEHADEIAYWFMSQKRGMAQMGAEMNAEEAV